MKNQTSFKIKEDGSIQIKESVLIIFMQCLLVISLITPFVFYIIVRNITHIGVLAFTAFIITALLYASFSSFKKLLFGSIHMIDTKTEKITYNNKEIIKFKDIKKVKIINCIDNKGTKYWSANVVDGKNKDIFLCIDQDKSKIRSLGKKIASILNVEMVTAKK